ncbi:MAG: MCE family protein, partial [Muribaculaceae bacterium]|nr:MCE family protein [Muribaculaceae bacterium]
VTLNGYKVGQVREINYDYSNPGHIRVLLALNKELQVPEDTRAMIGSNFLSGAFVQLQLGSSKKMLAVGSDIATGNAPDAISAITDEVMPKINAILPRVDTLLYNLNVLVADPALAASIGRLDGISSNLLLTSQGLNTAMNRQVPGILGNAGRITRNIDTITYNLTDLSRQLRELPLQSTMSDVEQITQNLSRFSESLNNSKSTLGKLTSDPELYNRLNTVAADIDSLIVDIKKNPKRYISIKLL